MKRVFVLLYFTKVALWCYTGAMSILKEIVRDDFLFHYAEDLLPGRTYTKHCHFLYEAYLLLEGRVDYTVGGAVYALKAYDMLLIPPQVFHCADVRGEGAYRRCVLDFSDAFLPRPKREALKNFPVLYHLDADHRIAALFARLMDYADKLNAEETAVIAAAYPAELLLLIERFAAADRDAVLLDKTPPQTVCDAIALINDRVTKPLDLNGIAAELFVSKYYLCHAFKKYVGLGLMEYARSRKLEGARLLIEAGIRPKAAAETYAFPNYTTFYRAYVAAYGIPPTRTPR